MNKYFLNSLIFFASALFTISVATKFLVFGSFAGGWVYPYFSQIMPNYHPPLQMFFLVVLTLIPLAGLALYFSEKWIEQMESAVLFFWFIFGFLCQALLQKLYPFSPGKLVENFVSNSYYTLAAKYNPIEFLANFKAIASSQFFHIPGNMPGKTLFFHLLGFFCGSPESMGQLIILFSNLGALLVFLITKELFKNKTAALYSAVLYLFLPSRILFSPILNTVSPTLILFSFFLFLKYLGIKKDHLLIFFGISLYIIFIFDPLVLSAGIIFFAILLKCIKEGRLSKNELLKLAGLTTLTFLAANYLAALFFKFDAIGIFPYIVSTADSFNLAAHRPYRIWILQNPIDFLVNFGIAQSTLLILSGMVALKNLKTVLLDSKTAFTISVLVLLLFLNFAGINRGEAARLWIFVMAFLQIIAALAAALFGNQSTIYLVLGCNILQCALCLLLIGFVIPL